MFSIPFLLAAWLTVSPFPQQSVSSSVVLVEFSRPMLESSLLSEENYSLVSVTTGERFSVDSVFIVLELDGIDVQSGTLIGLVTQRLKNKSEYFLTAHNITDLNGVALTDSTGWFYFNGFASNLFSTPSPGLYAP